MAKLHEFRQVFHRYVLVPVFQETTEDLRRQVVEFWMREGALRDRAEAERRAHELVYVITDEHEDIVGVCTTQLATSVRLRRSVYFLRLYVRPSDRASGLPQEVIRCAWHLLKDRTPPGGPDGARIVGENTKLARPGMMRVFSRRGWRYLGLNAHQLPVWEKPFSKS
ncbi:hypothetical protein B1B_10426 [mine drainage metagenome]|uniref:N-acetyltransferase domain-containing protein n=1 Tax=mine drainage metagenome TaxID=410659 RepID=T1BJ00_9ZZZZ